MRYTERVPDMVIEKVQSDPYFKPTNLSLAQYFCVGLSTIEQWKRTHKKFVEAVAKANELVTDNVENTLLKRLHGYDITEEKEEISDDGSIKRTHTKKHISAEPSLIKYYLNNRRSSEWSDKQEINQTGSGVVTVFLKESQKEEL